MLVLKSFFYIYCLSRQSELLDMLQCDLVFPSTFKKISALKLSTGVSGSVFLSVFQNNYSLKSVGISVEQGVA